MTEKIKIVSVEITDEMIRTCGHDSDNCPFHAAVTPLLAENWVCRVGAMGLRFLNMETFISLYTINDNEVQLWIQTFDKYWTRVSPGTFRVSIPEVCLK